LYAALLSIEKFVVTGKFCSDTRSFISLANPQHCKDMWSPDSQ